MIIRTKLRITGRQYSTLRQFLLPGDGKEAVCLGLCGVGVWSDGQSDSRVVCLNHLHPVHEQDCCERKGDYLKWLTDSVPALLKLARGNQVFLKIHSHPTGVDCFSVLDDAADKELFMGIAGWLDTDFPGISAIMLPDGRLIARSVDGAGNFTDVESVMVAGSDIRFWYACQDNEGLVPDFAAKTAQAFGQGTTELLSRLSVGVIGVSGTGSPVAEMLYRLGVGQLVLVDGDIVEEKNLNRIYNSTLADTIAKRPKVQMMADAIKRSGLPTNVVPIAQDLFDPEIVRIVAQCDLIFGCMDSIDGRDLLNRLCTFYSIPYFDLGVHLKADGLGGIEKVCGTVHYLQPDGSSLFSRGVYTEEMLRAAGLFRTDPEAYHNQVQSKYIQGINEERPAVVSVNTLIASIAINDMLARLHPFRVDPNELIASLTIDLTESRLLTGEEGIPDTVLASNVGRGDIKPLLNMSSLSERNGAYA